MKRRRTTAVRRAMKALDPVPGGGAEPTATDEQTEAALERVKASADREPTTGAARPAPKARRPVLALAAAGAMLLAGLAVALAPWDRSAPAIDRAMASVAANAAEGSPSYGGEGDVRYLRVLSVHLDTAVSSGEAWSTTEPEISEQWVAPGGEGRARTASLGQRFASPGDRATWEAAGRPNLGPIGPAFEVERQRLPREHELVPPIPGVPLRELPTEPSELRAAVESAAAEMNGSAPLPARALDVAGGILRNPEAPGDLREATYVALADLDGIEYLGTRSDPIGRPGDAIGVESAYSGGLTEFALLYDPDSGVPLAMTETGLERADWIGIEPPFRITADVYLAQGMSRDSRSLPPDVPALGKERAERLAGAVLGRDADGAYGAPDR